MGYIKSMCSILLMLKSNTGTYIFVIQTFTAQTSGDLRLVDGTNELNGRLEVYRSGIWGTVCRSGFDSSDGRVACRQLGYEYVSYSYNNYNSQLGTDCVKLCFLLSFFLSVSFSF